MSTRARILALPLGFALAMAIGACGSGDDQESSANVAPSPLTTPAATTTTTVPTTTTATTATTTVPTTTTAPVTTTTAPATTQPSGGATTTQPTTGFTGGARGAPAGCPSAVGGFIRDVRATDCGVARTVATAWFDAIHGGAAPDSTVEAAGYSCSGTLAGERASVTCGGSGGTVSFTASP